MPSPLPQRPPNPSTDERIPATYTVPMKGLGDAKLPALPAPEKESSREDAKHETEEASNRDRERAHRTGGAQRASEASVWLVHTVF